MPVPHQDHGGGGTAGDAELTVVVGAGSHDDGATACHRERVRVLYTSVKASVAADAVPAVMALEHASCAHAPDAGREAAATAGRSTERATLCLEPTSVEPRRVEPWETAAIAT